MFAVTNGTKQGCVLASLLFSIFFSMMLLIAFKPCNLGVPVQFHTDGNVFNLRRFQSHTKTFQGVVRDLLYADDCVLIAHSRDDAQQLFDRFHAAAARFGLTVSLKKTEVMFQPAGQSTPAQPVIKAGDTTIKAAFCPQMLLSTMTSVLGYPRTALPSAGSLSVFGMIMASDWTLKWPSIRQPS